MPPRGSCLRSPLTHGLTGLALSWLGGPAHAADPLPAAPAVVEPMSPAADPLDPLRGLFTAQPPAKLPDPQAKQPDPKQLDPKRDPKQPDPMQPRGPGGQPAVPPQPSPLDQLSNMRQPASTLDNPLAGRFGNTLALAPNMLGDTTSGTCGGLRFAGLLRVSIDHPTFGCSRLNIAENNSPLPRDRVYMRYNHFAHESSTDIFSDTPRGTQSQIDIDRYTLGFEKTFFGGRASTELRMQLNYQLTSDIFLTDQQGVTNLPIDRRDVTVGNLGWVNKFLLWQSQEFNFATGLGVNIPTEQPVRLGTSINNNQFVLDDPSPAFPLGRRAPVNSQFNGVVYNDTVNLSPFIGALYTPDPDFFAHGFMQVDVPLNKSRAEFSGSSLVTVPVLGTFNSTFGPAKGMLQQQVLMRFNTGVGYWVYQDPTARWVTRFAPTIEAHYTTTLQNAKLLNYPLNFFPGSAADLTVGNLENRRDIFNLTLGGTAVLGNSGLLGAGFVIPLSSGSNKPFDYELTVQLSWLFGGPRPAAYAGGF